MGESPPDPPLEEPKKEAEPKDEEKKEEKKKKEESEEQKAELKNYRVCSTPLHNFITRPLLLTARSVYFLMQRPWISF
jgi:hypothetical protein